MVDFVCKDSYDLRDFIALIDYLRSPKGCPWDREQPHESIRRNVLEEAYEVCEAIDEGSPEHLCEELGDLLMQVIFHASMAKDEGAFDMDAIADMACKKLVHRHPHVFGEVAADTPEKVLENWDAIKRADRAQQTAAAAKARHEVAFAQLNAANDAAKSITESEEVLTAAYIAAQTALNEAQKLAAQAPAAHKKLETLKAEREALMQVESRHNAALAACRAALEEKRRQLSAMDTVRDAAQIT